MNKYIRLSIASGSAAAIVLIGSVASAQTASFSGEMGVGARDAQVTSLQTRLQTSGYYSGPVTGYYGPLTKAAVERYQRAKGISATGYVGPLTLAALNGSASVSTGANASLLAQLQAQLASLLAQIQVLQNSSTTATTTTNSGVPTASAITLQASGGTSVSGTLAATGGTGPYTFNVTNNPTNGTLSSINSQTGAFTYTPNSSFSGADTFTYTATGPYGISAPTKVTINVASSTSSTSSNIPTGQALSFTTSNGAPINAGLSGSGTGTLKYSIATNPSHGTLSSFNPSTGVFTYTPQSGYTGSDSFTYTITNSSGTSTPYTVNLTD